jgi:hypothetical protein
MEQLTCPLCTGRHHALLCSLARPTLAALERPGYDPTPMPERTSRPVLPLPPLRSGAKIALAPTRRAPAHPPGQRWGGHSGGSGRVRRGRDTVTT